jgi:REP element-mobilizing transposase RayT
LIFTPKYRRDVFTDGEVRRMCLESFAQTCYALGLKIEACEFGTDHVHLFVSRCKNYSVPYMVQRFTYVDGEAAGSPPFLLLR